MKKSPLLALSAITLASLASAQPAFDAASIKPFNGPYRGWVGKGGPGSSDPGRVTRTATLQALILEAYELQQYQLIAPDWAAEQQFDFTATMPRGTTRQEYHLMLQKLLTDRFQLVAHRETRQAQVYKLVQTKGGSKLQRPAPDTAQTGADQPAADGPRKMEHDKDGYPVLRRDTSMAISSPGPGPGRARAQGFKKPIDSLVQLLAGQTGMPVIDATGLTGEFDYTLSWIPTRPGTGPSDVGIDVGPDLFQALPQQLGLKLEPAKGPVECLIVDSANKTPVEN